jgi:uncharacterized MnhB-related membrane protein
MGRDGQHRLHLWTPAWRAVVFILSAMSIWCLLADFYHLCPMRTFVIYALAPATAVLVVLAVIDRVAGDGRLWRAVVVGSVAGLLAAFAYDLFRAPFVVAAADKIGPDWLRLPLFKVFPRFGAMVLGHPFSADQSESQFTLTEHLVGWSYHFSNGLTFGVMYLALIGDAGRRSWLWAVAVAVGLEAAMLFTPYTGYFHIALTTKFVVATLLAHLIFGVVLGLYVKRAMARIRLVAGSRELAQRAPD